MSALTQVGRQFYDGVGVGLMAGAVAIETKRLVGKGQVFHGFHDEGGLVGSRPVNFHMAARERGPWLRFSTVVWSRLNATCGIAERV